MIYNAIGRTLSYLLINSHKYYYLLQSDIYISFNCAFINFLEERRQLLNYL